MLHITSGAVAAQGIRDGGLRGDVLCWEDVLHEGPVPGGLDEAGLRDVRARFIADCRWAPPEQATTTLEQRDARLAAAREEDEIVLWFEHDLFDQLQLVQVLSRLAPERRRPRQVTLVATNRTLGVQPGDWFRAEFVQREAIGERVWDEAVRAWDAFTAPEPVDLVALRPGFIELTFLPAAIGRHLQEFPSIHTGLSRFEGQLLTALARGPMDVLDAYHASHHDCEDAVYMGDAVFCWHLHRLSQGEGALVALAEGGPIAVPGRLTAAYWEQAIALTSLGERVVAGATDRVTTSGIDRWLGGVHLRGHQVRWRWDERHNRIIDTARALR